MDRPRTRPRTTQHKAKQDQPIDNTRQHGIKQDNSTAHITPTLPGLGLGLGLGFRVRVRVRVRVRGLG